MHGDYVPGHYPRQEEYLADISHRPPESAHTHSQPPPPITSPSNQTLTPPPCTRTATTPRMSAASTSLDGRVALVTGGSRGLGRAICVHLAMAGCSTVVVNYNSNEAAALETQSLITQAAPKCTVRLYRADVSDTDQVKQMMDAIASDCGTISVLVNNAGIGSVRELADITVDEFDAMYRTNLRSAFLCTQACYAAMVKQHYGRIINITSVAAYVGGPTGPHYAASKAGMIGLTHSYADRLAKLGVTSNAVAPGLVASDMVDNMCNTIGRDKVLARTGPGRLGTPDEVGSVVAMLAGNGYMNGQVIMVDGGMYHK